ncbi:MAG: hypothetical protein N5P05_004216 (plasmid) [Chroococcopsis gigantea SAG 12.99]|jgi:hypothetical protein|nr:hypothetical protein [Chroococcopsis gigantea SAG 12.99]
MTNSTENKFKSIKDEFAKFFEEPSRETLRDLLQNHLGEFPHLDFKQDWPDLDQIARHILGIANSGGGCIIIGVTEIENQTLEATGLANLTDKKVISDRIDKYLPHVLKSKFNICDFYYEASEYSKLIGKNFQVILIEYDVAHLPFLSVADGSSIKKDKIYVRRVTSTVEANHDEVQDLINKRIETAYSSSNEIDLREHLEELKLLYDQIKRGEYISINPFATIKTSIFDKNWDIYLRRIDNPHYPKEEYDAFIAKMIEKKKKRIEIALNVVDL